MGIDIATTQSVIQEVTGKIDVTAEKVVTGENITRDEETEVNVEIDETENVEAPETDEQSSISTETTDSPALGQTETAPAEIIQTTFGSVDEDITTPQIEDEVIPSVTPPTAVEGTNQPGVPVVEVSRCEFDMKMAGKVKMGVKICYNAPNGQQRENNTPK